MNTENLTPWDSAELLTDDEVVNEYLKAAIEENDPALFMKAVGNVARAKGMTTIAPETQPGQPSLFKALSGERDPRIDTVMKVLAALDVQLTISPKRE